MEEISVADWAYAAGIIDGEGCIIIYINPMSGHNFRISVGMKFPEVPDWLHKTFGGRRLITAGRYGDVHFWHCNKKLESIRFLTGIQPYVRLKTGQVKLGLMFLETVMEGGQKGISDRTLLIREHLMTNCQALNEKRKVVTDKEIQ